jgi:hypothetical protein
MTANANVATILGSILKSSDTAESEEHQMKQCRMKYFSLKIQENQIIPFYTYLLFSAFSESLAIATTSLWWTVKK